MPRYGLQTFAKSQQKVSDELLQTKVFHTLFRKKYPTLYALKDAAKIAGMSFVLSILICYPLAAVWTTFYYSEVVGLTEPICKQVTSRVNVSRYQCSIVDDRWDAEQLMFAFEDPRHSVTNPHYFVNLFRYTDL